MSLKHYGIYIAYPPTVDLRFEGLGRYLAMFLKGAECHRDVKFTIVCPSWTGDALDALFQSEQVPPSVYEVVSPIGKPYILRAFEEIKKCTTRHKRTNFFSSFFGRVRSVSSLLLDYLFRRAAAVHGVTTLVVFLLELIVYSIIATPLFFIFLFAIFFIAPIWVAIRFSLRKLLAYLRAGLSTVLLRTSALLTKPKESAFVVRLYEELMKYEARRMKKTIEALTHLRAWYSPTSFWPEFNEIDAPRLMCVPDVVLSEFPVGFAKIGGDRFLKTFEAIQAAIRTADYFVTYCETVKWNTLVDLYSVPPERVVVIRHAPNDLSGHIMLAGTHDDRACSLSFCKKLFLDSLRRSGASGYCASFQNGDVKFLFYASQFRPNKNVILLLRAFERLLRKDRLGYKLILTGIAGGNDEISNFINSRSLDNEVIFLNKLSVAELAACYRLAQLAICPSLSEGGGPFTFTEALSVGTPALLARIGVAEELIVDEELKDLTFFDPYSFEELADKTLFALNNREMLLKKQTALFSLLGERKWGDVVADHVNFLDKISKREIN